MEKNNSWSLGMEALYLAGCALRDEIPERGTDDPKELFHFCQFQTVTAIVAMALESYWKAGGAVEPQVRKNWAQARDQAIRKNLLFNTERQVIIGHLENLGCRHMLLKGGVLQEDYPKFGMRQMTDNDILVDPDQREAIHTFMMERGYTTGFYLQGSKVDTYQKPPVYNFEMHVALFSKLDGKELERYFRNIRDKWIKEPGDGFGYRLTDEDFYIYMVAHAYKHLHGGGIGIRNLLDIQVFLKKHREMNMDYVNRELKALDCLEFEQMCRILCGKLLDGDPAKAELTELEQQVMVSFFTSGTFGTGAQQFQSKFRRLEKDGRITWRTKLKFVFQRIFPPMEMLRADYLDIDRKPWKVPFILIWRPIRCLIHPVKTIRELRQIAQVRDK